MAKRKKTKKKSIAAKKAAKKKPGAGARKQSAGKKSPRKRKSAARSDRDGKNASSARGRAASKAGPATLLPPRQSRLPHQQRDTGGGAAESVTKSDFGVALNDQLRSLTNVDRGECERYPTQTNDHSPPTRIEEIAEVAAEQGDRLEETAKRLVDADKDDLLREALWWAGTSRLPRAAIVGRALHELKSFTEELAFKRGTAAEICQKIKDKNADHLRAPIKRAMASGKDSAMIDSSLIGLLNKAWTVLEKLDLLRAAPSAGVYLIGRGPTVFDGFPEWGRSDEELPEKPNRPPRRPRS